MWPALNAAGGRMSTTTSWPPLSSRIFSHSASMVRTAYVGGWSAAADAVINSAASAASARRVIDVGAPKWPPHPHRSERPGKPVALLDHPSLPPVRPRGQEVVGDEVAHHLERAAADGEHAGIPHHPLERQRAAVAGGAVDLQRLAGDLLGGLGRERLGLGGLQRVGKSAAGGGGGAMDQQAGGVELDLHVGQLPADALEVAEGPAELLALGRVGQRALEGALGEAERHGGGAEPLAVVGAHELLEAVAGADQQVLARHLAVLEVQLALGDAAQSHHEFAATDAEARRVALDEHTADAFGAGPVAEARVDEI